MKKIICVLISMLLLCGCRAEKAVEADNPTAAPETSALSSYCGSYVFAGVSLLSLLSSSTKDYLTAAKVGETFFLDVSALDNYVEEPYETSMLTASNDPLEFYGVTTQFVDEDGKQIIYINPNLSGIIWVADFSVADAGKKVIAGSIDMFVTAKPMPAKDIRIGSDVDLYTWSIKKDDDCITSLVTDEGEYTLCPYWGGMGGVDYFMNEDENRLYYTYSWGSGMHHCFVAYFDFETKETIDIYHQLDTDMMLFYTPEGIKVFSCKLSGELDTLIVEPTEYIGTIVNGELIEAIPSHLIVTGSYSFASSTWGMSVKVNPQMLGLYPNYLANWTVEGGTLCVWDEQSLTPIEAVGVHDPTVELIWVPNGATEATIKLMLYDPTSSQMSNDETGETISITLNGIYYEVYEHSTASVHVIPTEEIPNN